MTLFWKTTAGILIAVIFILALGKQEKDIALMLSILVCVMTAAAGFSFLEPVLEFLYRLEQLGNLNTGVLKNLLKIVGIGLVTEITEMILTDSGNTSLAKGMQLLGSAVILFLSLPILETLLELLQRILGEL